MVEMRMESLPRAPRWCASSPRIAGIHGKGAAENKVDYR